MRGPTENPNQPPHIRRMKMREITEHIVSGDQAVQLGIEVLDEPGAGGACHLYKITESRPSTNGVTGLSTDVDVPLVTIHFQEGPIKEAGINGITQEALIAITIDRLRSFQEGPYRCRENAIALTHFEEGLMWLQRRTVARIKRGVEGTSQK